MTPAMRDGTRALRELAHACAADSARLWGHTLCGPVLLIDPRTRAAVANVAPAPASDGGDSTFASDDGVFVGRIPSSILVANTSITWRGTDWATVPLPLPSSPFSRLSLLTHESFHRLQPVLHLRATDPSSAHLETEAGRTWMRLEVRALARALRSSGASMRTSIHDALLFRAFRNSLTPGSDTLERALEIQEGLPEYTGTVIALAATSESMDRVARDVEGLEDRASFARSFAYTTGPALGILLDRTAPGWRKTVIQDGGMARQLATATHFTRPANLAAAASARASVYGGTAVFAGEHERNDLRLARTADYVRALVSGPVLRINADKTQRSFDPNTLFPLDTAGTVYPTGTFAAAWGKLEVTNGALLSADYGLLTVAAPSDTSARPLKGNGWALELAKNWIIRPAQRAGDFELVPAPHL
ncbi:MAG: hypothetical protein ABJE47_07130 [bacterium]